MEQTADSDKHPIPTMCATKVFNNILNQIQISNLNFQLQLSPFSAHISLRKSFVKDRTGAILQPTLQSNNILDLVSKNLELENDLTILRKKYEKLGEDCDHAHSTIEDLKKHHGEIMKEKEKQCEFLKEESNLLQSKLEINEEKMVDHFSKAKDETIKLSSEISALKSEVTKARKDLKSNEKNIYNLEKKNENLANKIGNLQDSKNEVKKERDDLVKEIKKLRKNQVTKSNYAQTESESNNNLTRDHLSVQTLSSSTQTAPFHADSISGKYTMSTVRDFECYVCSNNFNGAADLKKHVEAEHELSINLDKLNNEEEEEDDFVRFVKSMDMASDYVQERIKYYPKHWDHIEERVKIRFLAKKKLEICSKHIENNMNQIDVKNIRYSGGSRDY